MSENGATEHNAKSRSYQKSTGTTAYYEPCGGEGDWEYFEATGLTVSAWGPELQHGAPPSALLTRAIERDCPSPNHQVARIVVDLLGPVPVDTVKTRARVVRPGRRIELVEAELAAGGRVVARASAWRMRNADTTGAQNPPREPRALPPLMQNSELQQQWSCGFIDSLDFRVDHDSTVWAKPQVPLVAGEDPTTIERVMMIADIANGVGAVLDPAHWRFLNTDLAVHLNRPLRGEWVGINARASIGPEGYGTTQGHLYDIDGPLGSTAQALLVEAVDTP